MESFKFEVPWTVMTPLWLIAGALVVSTILTIGLCFATAQLADQSVGYKRGRLEAQTAAYQFVKQYGAGKRYLEWLRK